MNAPERQALTVTELNTLAKEYLENLPLFRSVSVKGELSNVTLHRTGHIYFSIKDEGAAVSAVMWRSDAASLGFTPENGQKVTAEGKVTLWVQRGQYTFNVRTMQKDGAGDLFAAFEALKRKLAAEGLFDASRKKPLPKYPRTVGIITAPTGAAIRDMINVTGRRFPLAKILLYPTLVQGESAPPQMIEALQAFNREKKADVSGAAAARPRTCGRSTTKPSPAPSARRKSPSSRPSATRWTIPSPTSPPTCARPRRRPPPSWSCPTGARPSAGCKTSSPLCGSRWPTESKPSAACCRHCAPTAR